MIQKHVFMLAMIALTSGCYYPSSYSKHVRGRVVDKNEQPIEGALVSLGVVKLCGGPGGSANEPVKSVVSSTSQDGEFDVKVRGVGSLYFFGLAGCWGFLKVLTICKDGHWLEALTEYPKSPYLHSFNKARKDGSYVFDSASKQKDIVSLGRPCY